MNRLGMALILSLLASSAFAGDGRILRARGKPVPGQYIVQLAPGQDVRGTVNELALGHAARALHVYRHALQGATFQMSEHQAKAMARHPKVLLVEEDAEATIAGTQTSPPSWGLDRVDQHSLPLDASYTWDFDGTGVNAYIIDTGIRFTHTDFGGRAFPGVDVIGDGQNGNDCHGHGTHVAGTLGGSTFGVAKNVRLFSVRVVGCTGSTPISMIIAGVDWVTANRILPAVANVSLSSSVSESLDAAVNNSVNAGVFYAVAAGNNSGFDACNRSPARAANAFTVGATAQNDARASLSNVGSCLEMFAPGESITSTWNTGDTATDTRTGTSAATPHVAGAAAMLLDESPGLTPAQIAGILIDRATTGVLTDIGAGSPNRLLHTRPATIFADVPWDFWARPYIEAIYHQGITTGCAADPLRYCPGDGVSRAQVAVFLLRAKGPGAYVPPPCTTPLFADVLCTHWAAPWVNEFARRGITSGCGGGNYCPDPVVDRGTMAYFLLATLGIAPPTTCTGMFSDVPCSAWYAPWVEELARRGITTGCASGQYCPTAPVSRAEMAVFLVRTFGIPFP